MANTDKNIGIGASALYFDNVIIAIGNCTTIWSNMELGY